MRIAIYNKTYFPNFLDALELDQIVVLNIPRIIWSPKKADKILKELSALIPVSYEFGWRIL